MAMDILNQKILEYVYENDRDYFFLLAKDGTILQSTYTSVPDANHLEASTLMDFCSNEESRQTLLDHLHPLSFNELPIMFHFPGHQDHLYYVSGRPSYASDGNYYLFFYIRSMVHYQDTEETKNHIENYLSTILRIHDGYVTIYDAENYTLLSANGQYINYMRLFLGVEFYPGIPLQKTVSSDACDYWVEQLKKCNELGYVKFSFTNPLEQTLETTMIKNVFNGRSEILVLSKNITKEEKYRQELIDMNKTLESKVALRNAQLQESYNNLSLFNQVITHEMKTPIREISAYAGFLLEDNAATLPSDSLEDLTSIKRICSEVIECINEFVTFSKVTYTEMKNETVPMKELAYSVIEELSIIPTDTPVSYVVYDLPNLYGDSLMMKVVFRNILHNAIKFSIRNHINTITCGYMTDADHITYYINDRGVGFDSDNPSKVFDMFERAHSSSEFEGSGIGLSTVKAIVKRNHGEVDIVAEKDHGCTVLLKFPISQCVLTEDQNV
ncbi:MAG: hypothetical protein K5682_01610 [Lachnospiraceae bacterium]|nr:hypothetical protein [Lachnospiraceae bacterium]